MTTDPHAGAPILRAGGEKRTLAVIVVHGRGGTAAEMVTLGARLAPSGAALFGPQATGRSWWPTSFLAPIGQLEPWLGSALAAVGRAVDAARSEGFADDRIALMGFSQGACLALEYAARQGRPLHCVLGLSGALVGVADADGSPADDLYGQRPKRFDYAGRLDGTPVHLGCHERDPHIPLRRVRETEAALSGMGAIVTATLHPGAGHAVTREDVVTARTLLARPG
ncbi:MAG: alpha/beta hydrolase [Rubrimonas sp.]